MATQALQLNFKTLTRFLTENIGWLGYAAGTGGLIFYLTFFLNHMISLQRNLLRWKMRIM